MLSSRGSSDHGEEVRDDGWIDEDLRAGGPTLAPSPSITITLPAGSEYHQRLDARRELSKRIVKLLMQSKITFKAFTLCYRRCPLFLDDELVPTLLVDAKKKSSDEKWLSIAMALHDLLTEHGLSQFNVEICDARANTPKYSSPVPSSDPIHPLWDQILRQILDGIDHRFVLAIECFRYGESLEADKNPVTVIVTVDRTSNGPWNHSRETILSILSRHGLHHVAVLIIQGQVYRNVDKDKSNPTIPKNAWNDQMQLGLSLGIYESRHSSSTFGGWVEVKQEEGSAWKTLGLTCFHCVLPHLNGLAPIDRTEIRNTFPAGIDVDQPISKRLLKLEQPSLKDTTLALENLAKRSHRIPDARFAATKTIIEDGGDLSPRSRKLYDRKSTMLAEIAEKMTAIENFHKPTPSHLPSDDLLASYLPINPRMELLNRSRSYAGHVFAASGYRQIVSRIDGEKRHADWALLDVPRARHSTNSLSLTDGSGGVHCLNLQPFPGLPKEGGTQVIKLGRSTGTTEGRFSGLKSALLGVFDGSGVRSHVQTFEYAVLGDAGTPFSSVGDFGALVFDGSASCLGIIFAGNTVTEATYMTPLPDLFEDIKRVTRSAEVRLAE